MAAYPLQDRPRPAAIDWVTYRLLRTGTNNPAHPGIYLDYAADWDFEFRLGFRPDA